MYILVAIILIFLFIVAFFNKINDLRLDNGKIELKWNDFLAGRSLIYINIIIFSSCLFQIVFEKWKWRNIYSLGSILSNLNENIMSTLSS